MSRCEEVIHLIDGYLDGEVSLSERQIVASHLSSCRQCRSAFDARQSMSRAVKSSFTKLTAPRTITLDPLPKQIPLWRRFGWIGGGLSVAITAVAGRVIYVNSAGTANFRSNLAATFDIENGNVSQCRTKATKPIEMKKWILSQGISYVPHGLATRDPKLKVTGATIDSVSGHRGVHLKYKYQGHPIEMFVTPGTSVSGNGSVDKIAIKSWNSWGLNYWAMGSHGMSELDWFANNIQ